jgi:hypothetical protein
MLATAFLHIDTRAVEEVVRKKRTKETLILESSQSI